MRSGVLASGLVLAAAAFLAAQGFGGRERVRGAVYDEAGKPLQGVRVEFLSAAGERGFDLKTDKAGKWTALGVARGHWTVLFETVGYIPEKTVLDVPAAGRNPEFVVTLKKIAGLAVTEEIRDLLARANGLFDQKDYGAAAGLYERILAKCPDAVLIARRVADCRLALGQYEPAEQTYRKVLEKEPGNVEAVIGVGECLLARGDVRTAMDWYAKFDFDSVQDPVVLYNVGTVCYNASQFEDALKYYRKAVERQKDFLDALYQLGLTCLNLQKREEAVAAFERCLGLVPSDSPRAQQVRGFLEYLKK